jgi:hypothetical protein
MKRTASIVMSLGISIAASACATPGGALASVPPLASENPPSADPTASATAVPPSPSPTLVADPSGPSAVPASESTAKDIEYRLTYDWAVPSDRVTIPHTVQAPIAPAPALPLPYLVAIYVADHPESDPKYQRISFYFRGAFPEYNLQYVASVDAEGSGAPIPLEGNAFLRVGFISAQAHDNDGETTVDVAPENPLGLQNLKSYGSAGDFEGHVTYGLGIQVAPASDQVLPIRAGELKKSDGAHEFFYVVHVDVQNG